MIHQSRGGVFRIFDRRRVGRLLGAPLPGDARDPRFFVWQASTDLAYQEVLLRFDLSRESYRDLVRERGLVPFETSGPTAALPTDWSAPPEVEAPEWWTPSNDTPADAASGTVGVYGSIVAKWEDGHVYVLVEDTGHRSAPDEGS